MTIMQAIIYGLIQGFGEFLPISSSGHLILLPWIFNWKDPGLAFDVALHAGTLAAIMVFFRNDITILLKTMIGVPTSSNGQGGFPRYAAWLIIIATIPGALAGFFLNGYAETAFRSPVLIALALAIFGYLLYYYDMRATKAKALAGMTFRDSLIIGSAQALAIMPGVSRSGITITAGRLLGYDRVGSARFSFILSAPIILGASVSQAGDLFSNSFGLPEITALATSFFSGYAAIALLIRFIEKAGYKPFFYYRLILGAVIIFMSLYQ